MSVVLAQSIVSVKLTATEPTRPLPVRVYSHVFRQINPSIERFRTDCTLEIASLTMCFDVVVISIGTVEYFSTNRTRICRVLVVFLMGCHHSFTGERLSTFVALIGFLGK